MVLSLIHIYRCTTDLPFCGDACEKCGRSQGRAYSGWERPCQFSPAEPFRRRQIRPCAFCGTGQDFPPRFCRGRGFPFPARLECRDVYKRQVFLCAQQRQRACMRGTAPEKPMRPQENSFLRPLSFFKGVITDVDNQCQQPHICIRGQLGQHF